MAEGWTFFLEFGDQQFPLEPRQMTVGRSRKCDVSIVDPSISRRHVEVTAADGRIVVNDLGSSNGSFINGERLQGSAEVRDGDLLRLGDAELKVRAIGPAPAPADNLATQRLAGPMTEIPQMGDATSFLQRASVELARDALGDDDSVMVPPGASTPTFPETQQGMTAAPEPMSHMAPPPPAAIPDVGVGAATTRLDPSQLQQPPAAVPDVGVGAATTRLDPSQLQQPPAAVPDMGVGAATTRLDPSQLQPPPAAVPDMGVGAATTRLDPSQLQQPPAAVPDVGVGAATTRLDPSQLQQPPAAVPDMGVGAATTRLDPSQLQQPPAAVPDMGVGAATTRLDPSQLQQPPAAVPDVGVGAATTRLDPSQLQQPPAAVPDVGVGAATTRLDPSQLQQPPAGLTAPGGLETNPFGAAEGPTMPLEPLAPIEPSMPVEPAAVPVMEPQSPEPLSMEPLAPEPLAPESLAPEPLSMEPPAAPAMDPSVVDSPVVDSLSVDPPSFELPTVEMPEVDTPLLDTAVGQPLPTYDLGTPAAPPSPEPNFGSIDNLPSFEASPEAPSFEASPEVPSFEASPETPSFGVTDAPSVPLPQAPPEPPAPMPSAPASPAVGQAPSLESLEPPAPMAPPPVAAPPVAEPSTFDVPSFEAIPPVAEAPPVPPSNLSPPLEIPSFDPSATGISGEPAPTMAPPAMDVPAFEGGLPAGGQAPPDPSGMPPMPVGGEVADIRNMGTEGGGGGELLSSLDGFDTTLGPDASLPPNFQRAQESLAKTRDEVEVEGAGEAVYNPYQPPPPAGSAAKGGGGLAMNLLALVINGLWIGGLVFAAVTFSGLDMTLALAGSLGASLVILALFWVIARATPGGKLVGLFKGG